ncbi:MAG: helix-turn-helix transcriptional regulator [Azospirillaceae bacterium]
MTEAMVRGRKGRYFDDYLRERGRSEEVTEAAIKAVVAWQLAAVMKEQGVSKAAMARRLGTSRSQLDRLLDPDNDGVTLATLSRAAEAVGRKLRIELD